MTKYSRPRPRQSSQVPKRAAQLGMPNIASILKIEIARVARKEVRGEAKALKKAASTHRSEIAALKRRLQTLEQQVRRLGKPGTAAAPGVQEGAPATSLRYSAKSLISQRRRLGLSATDCGRLLGASAQSIYNWENGAARPLAKHLTAIAALRSLGRRDAAGHLKAIKDRTT